MPRLTREQMREVFDRLNAPGSSTRELADWYKRGGEGPAPKCVQEMAKATRAIAREMRQDLDQISKQDD